MSTEVTEKLVFNGFFANSAFIKEQKYKIPRNGKPLFLIFGHNALAING